jgi:hypothetical protein
MAIGDPSAIVVVPGAVLPQEDMTLVQRYIETLLVPVEHTMVVTQCHYRDAMVLKRMVLSFFR